MERALSVSSWPPLADLKCGVECGASSRKVMARRISSMSSSLPLCYHFIKKNVFLNVEAVDKSCLM